MAATFETFSQHTLSERIVESIISMIQAKELKPGDRLPAERELAAMMEVSRPALREALRALAIMNIVEIRPGSGTYITSLKPELLVEHLNFVFSLTDSTFLDLIEARQIIEVGLVRMAAARITDAEIAELRRFMDKTHTEIPADYEDFAEIDYQLHKMIAAAARNPILSRFLDAVGRLASESRKRRAIKPADVEQTARDHRAIVAAITTRDPPAAQKAMQEHLSHVRDRLVAQMTTSTHQDEPHTA